MRGARSITCQTLDPIFPKIDTLQSKCFCGNSAGSRYRGNRTTKSSVTSNVSLICQINWKYKCRMSTYGVCIEGNECFGFSQQRQLHLHLYCFELVTRKVLMGHIFFPHTTSVFQITFYFQCVSFSDPLYVPYEFVPAFILRHKPQLN